jgi:hypothetical protein
MRIAGFVDSLTWDEGIIVSTTRPPSGTYLRFPVTHDCDFFFGDKREIPEEQGREALAAKFGDAALTVTTTSGDRLVLFFNV